MANPEHVEILMQGVEAWNKWRDENPDTRPDLSAINLFLKNPYATENMIYRENNLYDFVLRGINLSGVNLKNTNLRGACLEKVVLRHADLFEADFTKANLRNARLEDAKFFLSKFSETEMIGAKIDRAKIICSDFSGAMLAHATVLSAELAQVDLRGANLSWANFHKSRMMRVDFRGTILIETSMKETIIEYCSIYGIAAWKLDLEGAKQANLFIKSEDVEDQGIIVDDLEVAQFIYLLLNNKKIRHVLSTVTSKVVLILGRFTPERRQVLDAIRDELRNHDLLPVVFDFEKPDSRDLTETVSTLAHMARFIIVDLTDPSSVPHEMAAIVPTCVVPVQPLLLDGDRQEYAMFGDLRQRYHWVLPTYRYQDIPGLLGSLKEKIIEPAEEKARELEDRKRGA